MNTLLTPIQQTIIGLLLILFGALTYNDMLITIPDFVSGFAVGGGAMMILLGLNRLINKDKI